MILFALAYLLLEKLILLLVCHVRNVLLDGFFLLRSLILSLLGHVVNIVNTFGIFAHNALFKPIWIASQHNIGATTSHVGRDGDCAAPSRLGDNLGFTLVMF